MCLITVNLKLIHRSIGVQGSVQHTDFRTLATSSQKFVSTLTHSVNVLTAKVHEIKAQSTGTGSTGQRRRLEGHNGCIRNLCAHAENHRNNILYAVAALAVVLHSNYCQAGVSLLAHGQDINTANLHNVFNAGELSHILCKACHNLLRTVTGSTLRQSDGYSSHALVLVRYKACRRCLCQETDADNNNNKTGQNQFRFTDAAFNVFHVFSQRSCKPIVKYFYSLADKALRRLLLLDQNQGAECRSQGQSYDSRKHHGYRNRNRKLLVQFTDSTAGEGYRNKYRRQYEGNSHNRAGNLVHSTVGCLLRRHTVFLNMMFNRFYYNNSVVDNKADSQNHRKGSQSVDGKT